MEQVLSGQGGSGAQELLIRKSKWLLFFILLRVFFFLFLLCILSFIILTITQNIGTDQQLKDIAGIIIVILISYFFIISIIWIIRYFYDVIICSNNKIWRIKLGLLYRDNIDVIELYRVQEMEVQMDGFFRIFFNVGDIAIIEQNDMKKIIHWIDRPKSVVFLIQELKESHIKTRHIQEVNK